MNTYYVSTKLKLISFILIVILFYPACSSKTVPFVIVRESDFRVGPVDLPLNDEGKKKITEFLLKGGDKQCCDIVTPNVSKAYASLLALLSDSNFLRRSNFRKAGNIGKISKILEPWFEKYIVYCLIDSQNARPPIIAPISLKDKNGKYWWVFYLPQPPANLEKDPAIIKVLITMTPWKDAEKY